MNKEQIIAVIVSIDIGILLAVSYYFQRLPITQLTMLISMLLLGCAGIYLAWQAGKRSGIRTFILIGLIGCLIEGIGIVTCRPYGCFTYSELLGPKFFNTFPLLLLGIWPFLVISIAHLIPKQFTGTHFITIGIALLLLLDLALDPVHISQGIWSYTPTSYHRFGVPLQNFIGRIITGGLSMAIVYKNKNVITHPARGYAGITIMTLFRVQFLLLIIL